MRPIFFEINAGSSSSLFILSVIEPEWKINTYDIFSFIDLGIIFNGTLGLEMMLSGIPMVSTGRIFHIGLGFAMEPETVEYGKSILLGN